MRASTPALLVILMAAASSGQKPCCAPDQFMAGVGTTLGVSSALTEPFGMIFYQYGAWDYVSSRFGYNMSINYLNGTTETFRMIINYAKGEQWKIIDSLKYCEKQLIDTPEPSKCIPDNATYIGSGFLGGVNGTWQNTWSMELNQEAGISGLLTYNVARDASCLPITSSFVGEVATLGVPTYMISGTEYVNVTLGIPQPDDWFTVPGFCTQNHFFKNVHRPMPAILKHMSFLY